MTATQTTPESPLRGAPTDGATAGPVPEPLPAERPSRRRGAGRSRDGATPAGRGPGSGGPREGRLLGVDAARGVALIGMMAVHALYATDAAGNPSLSQQIAGGRAAALFALLAGVGIAFTTGRRRVHVGAAAGPAVSLVARALVIGLIGLALGYTDTSNAAVILPYYAVLFLLAVPLVLFGTRTLVLLGAAAVVGIPFLSHWLRAGLPLPTLENPTFAYAVTDPLGLVTELAVTGYYPALSWTAYLCFGIAIGRLRLSRVRTATTLLVTGVVAAVASDLLSRFLLATGGLAAIRADAAATGMPATQLNEILTLGPSGTTPPTTRWWLAIDSQHSSTPLDLMHTVGTAAAVIGFMLLLGHLANPVLRGGVALVREPLAAAGSMTLTFYTLHIVFMSSPFDTYSAGTGYALQVAAVLLIGLAWRSTAGRGPLERLVARVSKGAASLVRRRPA